MNKFKLEMIVYKPNFCLPTQNKIVLFFNFELRSDPELIRNGIFFSAEPESDPTKKISLLPGYDIHRMYINMRLKYM